MSLLSDFEDRIGHAIEGVFAGVFRAPVQPAELARACAREMDRRRKLGVGKVYAPTMYSILLSPADGEQLGGFADTLAGELSTYLVGYAREKDYELSTRPVVRFHVDDDLKLGRFEVIGELLSESEIAALIRAEDGEDGFYDPHAEEPHPGSRAATPANAPAAGPVAAPAPAPPVVPASPAAPVVFDIEAEDGLPEPVVPAGAETEGAPPAPEPPIATVTVPGIAHDVVLHGDKLLIGRLKGCDICLTDSNTSRQHAAIEREGAGFALVDLESTNGTTLNGERIARVRLRDGDIIGIGTTELVFHQPRS